MNDEEFDVLDELYFIISFDDLLEHSDLDRDALHRILIELKRKEWVRVYREQNEEIVDTDLEADFESYFYLASKKGLMAHNRQ